MRHERGALAMVTSIRKHQEGYEEEKEVPMLSSMAKTGLQAQLMQLQQQQLDMMPPLVKGLACLTLSAAMQPTRMLSYLPAAPASPHSMLAIDPVNPMSTHVRDVSPAPSHTSCKPANGSKRLAHLNGHVRAAAVYPSEGMCVDSRFQQTTADGADRQADSPEEFCPQTITLGMATSMGTRDSMEDFAFAQLLDWTGMVSATPKIGACFGIFDGHGGHEVAQSLVETVPSSIQDSLPQIISDGPAHMGDMLVRHEQRMRHESWTTVKRISRHHQPVNPAGQQHLQQRSHQAGWTDTLHAQPVSNSRHSAASSSVDVVVGSVGRNSQPCSLVGSPIAPSFMRRSLGRPQGHSEARTIVYPSGSHMGMHHPRPTSPVRQPAAWQHVGAPAADPHHPLRTHQGNGSTALHVGSAPHSFPGRQSVDGAASCRQHLGSGLAQSAQHGRVEINWDSLLETVAPPASAQTPSLSGLSSSSTCQPKHPRTGPTQAVSAVGAPILAASQPRAQDQWLQGSDFPALLPIHTPSTTSVANSHTKTTCWVAAVKSPQLGQNGSSLNGTSHNGTSHSSAGHGHGAGDRNRGTQQARPPGPPIGSPEERPLPTSSPPTSPTAYGTSGSPGVYTPPRQPWSLTAWEAAHGGRDPGSTALVATIVNGTMHVANCGDCRLILGELDGAGKVQARRITCDHTATHPGEAARLAALQVPVSPDGYVGCLQVSRSIGDFSTKVALGELVILSEPELHTVRLGPQTMFCVAASDGITCAIPDETVINLVCKYLNDVSKKGSTNDVQHAAQELVRYAIDSASSQDNASVVIATFKHAAPPFLSRPRQSWMRSV